MECAGIADVLLGVGGVWMSSLSSVEVYSEAESEEPGAADDTNAFSDTVGEGVVGGVVDGIVEGASDGIREGEADRAAEKAVDGIL